VVEEPIAAIHSGVGGNSDVSEADRLESPAVVSHPSRLRRRCLSKALLSDWKRRSHALVELFPSRLFGYPFLGNGKGVFFVSQKIVSC
jgi:hypothetical protein